MNLLCNMMLISATCIYLVKFKSVLMMTICLRLIKLKSNYKLWNCIIDWCLHLEDLSTIQTISGMLHQLMDPRGEYLENYIFADVCQKLNASTKAVYVTHLYDALIIQLNIFKYSVGISKRVVLNWSINKESLLWGNGMVLSGVNMRENSLIADIKHQELIDVDNTWFLLVMQEFYGNRNYYIAQRISVFLTY